MRKLQSTPHPERNPGISLRSLMLAAFATATLPAGCTSPDLDSEQFEIVGGQEAASGTWSSMVAIDRLGDTLGPFWCGGTYVAPGWVLSAAHCFDDTKASSYQVIADRHDLTGLGGYVVGVTQIIRHPGYNASTKDNDIALLELSQLLPLPTVTLAGRYEMNGVITGEAATAIGWGDTAEGGSSSATLQEVGVEVIGVGDTCEVASGYGLGEITDNQICIGHLAGGLDTCQGDSGGPIFIRRGGAWAQIGITSWGRGCARPDLPGVYTLVPNYRTWIAQQTGYERVAYTPGDFNGDLKTDLVITTPTGSYWNFSNGNGTWAIPYTRHDLPLGEVEYVPGDFNGDGKTDLVLTTAMGSYWYFSSGNGSWTNPHTRADLRLGAVRYVPGDFNGDGKTDLVITTATGSTWYFSNGNGTWTTPHMRSDLTLGTAEYTPGDFNGDGKTDLVVTTPLGSYWYFSNGNGTWTNPYTRNDLIRGRVEYTAGDFNGDGKTDLVITVATGSYWYFSNGNGTWTEPYTRHDLPLGKVRYTTGKFNADLRTDLVITVATGSYWYFSNGNGTWTEPYTRNDLPLGQVKYVPGNFNGDGKADLVITTPTASYWYFSNGDGTWTVPYSDLVYMEDFESTTGWTVNPLGTDTATSGMWERGDPAETKVNGYVYQPGTTPGGTNCLVTGRAAGIDWQANDVDNGKTTIRSPSITLPSGVPLTLSFRSFLAHDPNATSADSLRIKVQVVGSAIATVVYEELAASAFKLGAWGVRSVNLSAYAGKTIQLLVEATDASPASVIEAGVDVVRIFVN